MCLNHRKILRTLLPFCLLLAVFVGNIPQMATAQQLERESWQDVRYDVQSPRKVITTTEITVKNYRKDWKSWGWCLASSRGDLRILSIHDEQGEIPFEYLVGPPITPQPSCDRGYFRINFRKPIQVNEIYRFTMVMQYDLYADNFEWYGRRAVGGAYHIMRQVKLTTVVPEGYKIWKTEPANAVTGLEGARYFASVEARDTDSIDLTVWFAVPTSITLSPVTAVQSGSSVQVSGSIDPLVADQTVVLQYTDPSGASFARSVRTDSFGRFTDSFPVQAIGTWKLAVRYAGDQSHLGSEASIQFEVVSAGISLPLPSGEIISIPYWVAVAVGLTAVAVLALILLLRRKVRRAGLSGPSIYCVDCGAENPAGHAFCRKCGRRLITTP